MMPSISLVDEQLGQSSVSYACRSIYQADTNEGWCELERVRDVNEIQMGKLRDRIFS